MKREYQFIGKSVYLEREKALVISDLHIGYEEGLNISMPRGQYGDIVRELEEIFAYLGKSKHEIVEVIILGDLKHEFSKNIRQEWDEVRKFFSFLSGKIGERGKIILVKGNHDNFIETIASRYDVKVVESYTENENVFIHGDKIHAAVEVKEIRRIFVGHFHPAIRLEEGVKSEIYKCFLRGEWKGKEVVILPSFFPLIEGVDVAKEELEENNLAYDFNLRNFEVFVPAERLEVLKFGKVKDVRRLF